VFSKSVDLTLKEICLENEKRYDIHFLEIGTDKDHVLSLVQSVPTKSASELIRMIKSVTAREVFKKHPEVKVKLWGSEFWTDGFFVNTVSEFRDESSITKYVRDQGLEKEYTVLPTSKQSALF